MSILFTYLLGEYVCECVCVCACASASAAELCVSACRIIQAIVRFEKVDQAGSGW